MAIFIYTRAATLKIYNDLKRFIFIFSASMQALYIGYLVYALAVGVGILFVNIALMALSVAYLAFMTVQHVRQSKLPKNTVEKVGKAYRWSRICIKAFTLGATLYGIHIAATKVNTVTVILAALTAIAWMMSVLFELVKIIFERYYELIESAFAKDMYPIKKKLSILPGITAEPPIIEDAVDRKLNALGCNLRSRIDADKLLMKAEKRQRKREKRQARRDAMLSRVKKILPFKRRTDSDARRDPESVNETVTKK